MEALNKSTRGIESLNIFSQLRTPIFVIKLKTSKVDICKFEENT